MVSKDVKEAAKEHAQALNTHSENLLQVALVQQHTQQELKNVRHVLKQHTGARTSSELYVASCENTQASKQKRISASAQVEAPKAEDLPRVQRHATQVTSDIESSTCTKQPAGALASGVSKTVDATTDVRVTVQTDPEPETSADKRITRQGLALACLVLVANSTAVITNALSFCTHPTCLMLAKSYGVASGSLAIIWFCYEHVQKARKEAKDKNVRIDDLKPLDADLLKDLVSDLPV